MFDVILADPPWDFEVWSKDTGSGRSACAHYPTMSLKESCGLPTGDYANPNCALFLWVPWPRIFDAQNDMAAWGFAYATKAWTWIKSKRSGFGFHMGMGYYSRANDEPCLLGIRGQMPVARHDILSLIYAPVREHSRKPDDQYRKIEALYPNMRYLELFARRKQPSWDVWGNEVESTIEIR